MLWPALGRLPPVLPISTAHAVDAAVQVVASAESQSAVVAMHQAVLAVTVA